MNPSQHAPARVSSAGKRRPFRTRPHPARPGAFALVAVLAILALILVAVVSLSSVLHVETRSSASLKDLTLARQNALLGLETAIGQLQLYAGKDQAVTFPATTFYPKKNVNDPQAAAPRHGKGPMYDDNTFGFRRFASTSSARSYLTNVGTYLTHQERGQWNSALNTWWQNRNPRWVGIMDSSLRVDAATNPNGVPAPLPAQRYESNPNTKFGEFKRDQLPVWLVSGNEKFRINQETGQVFDSTGAVVAANSYPTGYQLPDTALPDPVDPNAPGGSDEAKKVVWLVGDGSATTSDNSTDGLDGRVKARKQEIKAPGAGNTTQTIGHYAYWVGDESTKANFAVRDPYFDASPGSVAYRNRLQSPQRVGWENMRGFSNATFSVNDPGLENISTSKEITLLEKNNTTEIFQTSKQNYHSLTAFSKSLLTDPALGGLKKDLTAYLINDQGLNANDPIPDRSKYQSNDPRFRAWNGTNTGFPQAANSGGLPTWGQIKSWYQNTSGGGTIVPNKDTAPVLTYISLHMGVSYDPPTSPGGPGTLNWHWAPQVVLWNPYDVGLSAGTYDLEIQVAPNMWRVHLCNTNPSLEQLQRDAGAQWDNRAVGPVDPITLERVMKRSFRATEPNPDFPDGHPLRNYWPVVETSNAKYTYFDASRGPDGYNIGGLGPFVYDDNFNDGTSDAFGRFFYMLRQKPALSGRVRNPFKSGTRTSSAKADNYSFFGANSPEFGMRLNPHNNSNDGNNPLPVKAILRFQISSTFQPGEAKVFTYQPGGASPASASAWDPVAQPPLPLSPGVEIFDHPATVWFPAFDVINGPADASNLRFFGEFLPSSRVRPAVRLSIGGQTIMEADQFGGEEDTNVNILGKTYGDLANFGPTSGLDYDGDGVSNQNESAPKFVNSWRPVYSRADFYNNFRNRTSDTASSLWFYCEHFFNPFVAPPGSGFVYSGSGTKGDVHQNIAAFSRFNFGARSLDLHPLVDRLRAVDGVNNRNYLGNSEGLARLYHTKSYAKTNETYWDNKQFSGDNGFALITYRNDGPAQTYLPLSYLPVRIARRPNSNVISLGQFQQVNLSPYFWQPAFPVGNSWAGLYNDREAAAGIHSRQVGVWSSNTGVRPVNYIPNNSFSATINATGGNTVTVPDNVMLDMSYVLNENLWDRYFLSTIPNGLSQGQPLPNSRMRFTREAASSSSPSSLRNFDTSAAHLENFGALNVNSTSVEAWKALLTAFRNLELANNPENTVPVARSLDPIGSAIEFGFTGGNGSVTPSVSASHIGATASQKDYQRLTNGLRYLTDGMIAVLAERIVDEVRLRGPFFSLADFVNRRLVAPQGSRDTGSAWFQARTNGWATGNFPSSANSGTTDSYNRTINTHLDFISPNYDPFIGLHGLTGALQRALDVSGINGGVNDARLGWNGSGTLTSLNPLFNDSVFLPRLKNTGPALIEMQARNDSTNNQAYTGTGVGGAVNSVNPTSYRLVTEPALRSHLDTEHLAGAPAGEVGLVFQGAPGFVTQGDLLAMIGPALTSRGDTFLIRTYGDTVDRNGRLLARAWLEAVVQRVIEPVSPASNSGPDQYRYTDRFGRKFKVLTMRWLNPEEV